MKSFRETKIIGIDHGYGNMKTANHCFKTGISAYDSEPLFTADMLTYNGKYYLIGDGHKEFAPDKVKDEDYYVLTLAAIAKELKAENLTEAHIRKKYEKLSVSALKPCHSPSPGSFADSCCLISFAIVRLS